MKCKKKKKSTKSSKQINFLKFKSVYSSEYFEKVVFEGPDTWPTENSSASLDRRSALRDSYDEFEPAKSTLSPW